MWALRSHPMASGSDWCLGIHVLPSFALCSHLSLKILYFVLIFYPSCLSTYSWLTRFYEKKYLKSINLTLYFSINLFFKVCIYFACVCAHMYLSTHICLHVEATGQPGVSFLKASLLSFYFWDRVSLQSRTRWLGSAGWPAVAISLFPATHRWDYKHVTVPNVLCGAREWMRFLCLHSRHLARAIPAVPNSLLS